MDIPSKLDTAALARLHFTVLTQEEQAAAIRRLAATGQHESTIAHATGLSVEMVRRVLVEACPRTGIPMRFCTCAGPHG